MVGERPGRKNKVTIRTVAEDAGVSVAAVSKVLRNAYGVSTALRTNVLESIDRLGYRPSTAARAMRGRTYTIGILLVEISNPFLPGVVAGVQATLGPASYQALIGVGQATLHIESSLIESMMDMRMDGLLLIAPRLTGDLLDHFAQQVPMVLISHHEPGARNFDTVNSDDRSGARRAVEAMLARGHGDVAMLSLPEREGTDAHDYVLRERGYLDAMSAAGLADRARVLRMDVPDDDTMDGLEQLLSAPDRPGAVFCWSDLHAVPLINVARSSGLRVPDDLAVVGYDNSPIAAMPLIDLSTVDQNGRHLGEVAAQTLLTRIEGRRTAEHVLIDSTLVQRSSF